MEKKAARKKEKRSTSKCLSQLKKQPVAIISNPSAFPIPLLIQENKYNSNPGINETTTSKAVLSPFLHKYNRYPAITTTLHQIHSAGIF